MPGEASAALWLGVAAVGAYHGLNPAMGWPLAVARGLSDRRASSVLTTFVPLAAGHLLAIALVLLPFALLSWLSTWSREIRVGAGLLVLGFGVARLFLRRHPRWLMRLRPTQLMLWSLLMATAHGAALNSKWSPRPARRAEAVRSSLFPSPPRSPSVSELF